MAESSRLFSKADVRALRPSTSIADPGVVALQDELDRVGQQILHGSVPHLVHTTISRI